MRGDDRTATEGTTMTVTKRGGRGRAFLINPDLVSKLEICERLGVTARTFERWRHFWKDFPRPVTPSKRYVRWRRADVDEFFRRQSLPAAV